MVHWVMPLIMGILMLIVAFFLIFAEDILKMKFQKMKTKPKQGDRCLRCGKEGEFMIKIHYPTFDGIGSGQKYPLCDRCWHEWGELLSKHEEEKLLFLKLIEQRLWKLQGSKELQE